MRNRNNFLSLLTSGPLRILIGASVENNVNIFFKWLEMTILYIKYVDLKCFPYTNALLGNSHETGELFSLENIFLGVMIKCR